MQVDEEGNLVLEPSNVDESTLYLAFLTEAYKARTYWFVVVENTRRLLLSSALIVFAVVVLPGDVLVPPPCAEPIRGT